MSFLDKPASGLVLGKFMPPHQGHVYLCDFARNYCQRLTILVCSLEGDPIAGAARQDWMRQLFPDCRVVWCREDLPQAPEDHPDFWAIWRDVIERHVGGLDVVFASEDYGARLAEETGARFVPVDQSRTVAPISGTAIRANPFKFWAFLPAPVRAHFTKRVCMIGPESTGKSSLAADLAQKFETVLVPEYGRVHTEQFGVDIDALAIQRIVQGHLASVSAAKRQANRVLIEDTDPVLTGVWSDMLTGGRPEWFAQFDDYADLYLLCDIDLPWTDDGTRYFPLAQDRRRFFEACQAEVAARGLRCELVSGRGDQRRRRAVEAVLRAFPGLGA